jgi:hypothetical protein
MNKSEIAGLTYRSKEVGEVSYTGTKRVASSSEKAGINSILSSFLSSIIAKHS